MSEPQRVGSLEIGQDLDFQRREWRVQRFGWALMALIILGALLGLTGTGLLADAEIGESGSPLRLEYSRIDRLEAPTGLTVRVEPGATDAEKIELRVARSYLDGLQIQRIVPQPDQVRTAGDDLIYVFGGDAPGEPIVVAFDIRHETFGWKHGAVGIAGKPALKFSQLVLP